MFRSAPSWRRKRRMKLDKGGLNQQGNPLSPLLFNLAIEPLLACLHIRLHGIHLPGLVFKVSAFADDVLLGVDSQADFQVAQECLTLYAAASNAKLNADKCQTLVLGD